MPNVTRTRKRNPPDSDFPKLAQPAQRALASAGYVRLEQLTNITEAELSQLHGMGPSRRTHGDKPNE